MSNEEKSDYSGCSDGACVFGHPGGQHTNGGCRCLSDLPVAKRMEIRRRFEAYKKYGDALRFVRSVLTTGSIGETPLPLLKRAAVLAAIEEALYGPNW